MPWLLQERLQPRAFCLRSGVTAKLAAEAAPARSKNGQEAAFDFASFSHVSPTVSGLRDRDTMPSSISHCARSGWSLGPWRQMQTYLPLAGGVLLAIYRSFLTDGSRSSNTWA